MRSSLLALLASTAIVSASSCAQNNLDDLVSRISCGTNKSIAKCLRADVDLRKLEEIETCLVAGGCELQDATAEAVWFAYDCRAGQAPEELKRRQDDDETTTEETTSEEKTTTKKTTTAKTTSAKTTSTTAPSSTEVTTTSESTSSESTTSTTSDSTATSTTSTSSSSTTTASLASATTTGNGNTTCSETSTHSISACSVSNGKTLTCTPTTSLSSSCAAGMICFTATPGVCMKRKDSMDTSGIVVAIVFGVGLAATIITVIAMITHGKQKLRKEQQAQLLAAAASKGGRSGGGAERNPFASDANLPLIAPGGTRSEQANYSQQDYFEGAGQGGTGSLTPPEYRGVGAQGAPPAPQLHQGLGALGQNPRY